MLNNSLTGLLDDGQTNNAHLAINQEGWEWLSSEENRRFRFALAKFVDCDGLYEDEILRCSSHYLLGGIERGHLLELCSTASRSIAVPGAHLQNQSTTHAIIHKIGPYDAVSFSLLSINRPHSICVDFVILHQ